MAVRGVTALLCALALMLAAGCGGVPTALTPPVVLDAVKGRRIGVIARMGNFTLQKVGMTIFANQRDQVPVPAWGIDDLVASKIAALLGGSADVKQIAYAKDAFAAYEAPGGLFRNRDAELRGILHAITVGQKYDVFLVVIASDSAFGSGYQRVTGLGIVQSGSLFVTKAFVYALFQLRIYDGRTLELLGAKPAIAAQDAAGDVINGPYREVDKSWWPDAASVETDTRLKAAARELVEQALARTLPEVLPPQH